MAVILIIDDDAAVSASLQFLLEADGHEVLAAGDCLAGLALYRANEPPIVITDLIMPGRVGLEVIDELKSLAPTVSIIAISGGGRSGNSDILELARARGADEVLAKPFEPETLLELIQRMAAAQPYNPPDGRGREG